MGKIFCLMGKSNSGKDTIFKELIKDNIIISGNTVNPRGLDALKNKIIELFNINEIKSKNYNYLSNARQIALVKESLRAIENSIKSVKDTMPLEMVAVDIDEAYELLGEIIGSTYKEELLDELFSKFCLGK